MSADAITRYENVKKYKCHVTIEQWNNRSNLIIKLSKSYSKKNNRKKKSEKISKCHVCRRDHRATGSVTHITSDSKVEYAAFNLPSSKYSVHHIQLPRGSRQFW